MAEQRVKELEAELAAVQDQVMMLQKQAAQKTAEASIHALAARTPLPVIGFMTVPSELRDMIYDMCVAKGKVLMRLDLQASFALDLRLDQYSFSGTPLPDRPQGQLLRVSKQVSKEVLRRFLATNTFYGMPSHCKVPNFDNVWSIVNGNPHDTLPATRLSVTFDARQWSLDAQLETDLAYIHIQRHRRPNGTPTMWRRVRHIETVRLFDAAWVDLIAEVLRTKCSYLEVNLQNCFCPCQCECMARRVARRLADHSLGNNRPEEIRFLGVSDRDVRRDIRDMFKARRAPTGPAIELSFAATLAGFDWGDRALWTGVDEIVVDDPEEAKQKNGSGTAVVPPGNGG